jgi:hypothetical protein
MEDPLGTAGPHSKWSPLMQQIPQLEGSSGTVHAGRAIGSAATSAMEWERRIGMAVVRGAVGFPPAHRQRSDGRSDNG